MRMWMVDPRSMCRRHLLGEHVELHMLEGTLRRGRSVDGYVRRGLLEVGGAQGRHADLAREMVRRGMRHRSPLSLGDRGALGRVDRERSLRDLHARCAECRSLAGGEVRS